MKKNTEVNTNDTLPVLPLRNVLVMPNTVTPLLIGRKASVNAIEQAMLKSKLLFCVTQKINSDLEDDPKPAELYRTGTVCQVLQMFKLPDGNLRILVNGEFRAKTKKYTRKQTYLSGQIYFSEKDGHQSEDRELRAKMSSFKKMMREYIRLQRNVPEESLLALNEFTKPLEFFYFAMANIDIDTKEKQSIYNEDDFGISLDRLYAKLAQELEILKLEQHIEHKVKNRLNKLQKEYYLNEQLKIIHKELGISDREKEDVLKFRELLKSTPLSAEAKERAEEEIKKLTVMGSHSQEYGVSYNYLQWIFSLPWKNEEAVDFDLKAALQTLDGDHYGLKKVKDRILEFLAYLKIAKTAKGQILCFVGPPGVGKTSLGKSIATATGRKFVRLSLGGVRDEAEIRGHRRTYIGALPGIIMQSMKKAGSKNTLIMMDEVDKMSADFRGDPSSALLEVLDPEQNNSFRDHYLDFDYDLSQVLFITTANTLSSIPHPLLDRMEVIELPGYTDYEKTNIALLHLIPKQLQESGLKNLCQLQFPEDTVQKIIGNYTREAGVRELDRKIATVFRKIMRKYVEGEQKENIIVRPEELESFLGVEKILYPEVNSVSRPGVVTGLAWTRLGGETLQIEVVKVKGTGKLKLTGKLGDVMKESAEAALSYTRLHAKEWNIEPNFYKNFDLHLHIPEGAIPKDGPSAGVSITTALVSCLTGLKVDHRIAMTGEITLSGKVLAIGGLPEKLIAAKRAGIKEVIIPAQNHPHYREISEEIKSGLEIVFVDTLEEVLRVAIIRENENQDT